MKIKVGLVLWCIKVQICKQSYCEYCLQIWTLIHHSTQPTLIFNRARVFHLDDVSKFRFVKNIHSRTVYKSELWYIIAPKANPSTEFQITKRSKQGTWLYSFELAKQARIYRVTNVWVTFSICLTYRRAIYVMPDYIGTSKAIVYKSFGDLSLLVEYIQGRTEL